MANPQPGAGERSPFSPRVPSFAATRLFPARGIFQVASSVLAEGLHRPTQESARSAVGSTVEGWTVNAGPRRPPGSRDPDATSLRCSVWEQKPTQEGHRLMLADWDLLQSCQAGCRSDWVKTAPKIMKVPG